MDHRQRNPRFSPELQGALHLIETAGNMRIFNAPDQRLADALAEAAEIIAQLEDELAAALSDEIPDAFREFA